VKLRLIQVLKGKKSSYELKKFVFGFRGRSQCRKFGKIGVLKLIF